MNTIPPAPSTSSFEELRFLWSQYELQVIRADNADEMTDDSLGQLLYVDDYSSLSPDARKYIDDEVAKLNSRISQLSLVNNVIAQSVIIAVDRVIKGTSQSLVDAKKGPMISTRKDNRGGFRAPEVFWALSVRCAANYVRHAGEWKSEAVTFQLENGVFPSLNDFRRGDTQSNLTQLSTVLDCTIEHLINRDCSLSLAKRLDLLGEHPLEELFQGWKAAL
jgi:hypothetical protein